MAKDFCFMFYPGDYLRDTQCLSNAAQVAYDRIMCEHMRNICISQQQHTFFTKKLNIDEKEELDAVLKKVDGGYQIEWVVDSIMERLAYSESRAKNRTGKKKKKEVTYEEDMKSYVPHMEGEGEYINSNSIKDNKGGVGEKEETPQTKKSEEIFIVPEMLAIFKSHNPGYVFQKEKDFPALKKIADAIAEQEKIELFTPEGFARVKETWMVIAAYTVTHRLYKQFSLFQIEKYIQSISLAIADNAKNGPSGDGPPAPEKKTTIQRNIEAAAAATNYLAGKYSSQD